MCVCAHLSVTQQVDVLIVWTEHHVPEDGLPVHHRHCLIEQSIVGRCRDPVHPDLKHTQEKTSALQSFIPPRPRPRPRPRWYARAVPPKRGETRLPKSSGLPPIADPEKQERRREERQEKNECREAAEDEETEGREEKGRKTGGKQGGQTEKKEDGWTES